HIGGGELVDRPAVGAGDGAEEETSSGPLVRERGIESELREDRSAAQQPVLLGRQRLQLRAGKIGIALQRKRDGLIDGQSALLRLLGRSGSRAGRLHVGRR